MGTWMRSIICFATALMLISLILTDKLKLYVHPRFQFWIGLSIILLIILGWVQIMQRHQPALHHIGVWGYALLLLPVFAYLLLPAQALDARIGEKKGSLFAQTQSEKTTSTSTVPSAQQVDDPNWKQVQQMKKQTVISIDESRFADQVTAINGYPQPLSGKKLRITGMVYRDPEIKKADRFVIGRFILTCCAADATVLGLTAESQQNSAFKDNQWYEVTGTLTSSKEKRYTIPVLKIESYKSVPAPKDPYVYFS